MELFKKDDTYWLIGPGIAIPFCYVDIRLDSTRLMGYNALPVCYLSEEENLKFKLAWRQM